MRVSNYKTKPKDSKYCQSCGKAAKKEELEPTLRITGNTKVDIVVCKDCKYRF